MEPFFQLTEGIAFLAEFMICSWSAMWVHVCTTGYGFLEDQSEIAC